MKIHIPTPLRTYTGGLETVSVSGATVDAVFQQLTTTYPELKQHLFTPGRQAAVVRQCLPERRRHPLPGRQEGRPRVKDSDELTIIPSIAGGVIRL